MISAKKLTEIARTWKSKTAAMRGKGISFRNFNSYGKTNCSDSSWTCATGHFVIYTIDCERFVLPLAYLSYNIFRELLNMSEELFGLQNGQIIWLYEAAYLKHIVLLVRNGLVKEIEKALLSTVKTTCQAHLQPSVLNRLPNIYLFAATEKFYAL